MGFFHWGTGTSRPGTWASSSDPVWHTRTVITGGPNGVTGGTVGNGSTIEAALTNGVIDQDALRRYFELHEPEPDLTDEEVEDVLRRLAATKERLDGPHH